MSRLKEIFDAANADSRTKYVMTFFLSLAVDFLVAWDNYAMVHDRIVLQAVIGFAIPFFNLLCVAWFIEEKTLWGRVKLTTCVAFAQALGSTIMLLTVAHR